MTGLRYPCDSPDELLKRSLIAWNNGIILLAEIETVLLRIILVMISYADVIFFNRRNSDNSFVKIFFCVNIRPSMAFMIQTVSISIYLSNLSDHYNSVT